MPRRVLIIGAASAIAEETARLFAADGDALFLIARSTTRLEAIAADLRVRGAAQAQHVAADLTDIGRHEALVDEAERALGGLDTVLIAHGTLGDQRASQQSWEETDRQ